MTFKPLLLAGTCFIFLQISCKDSAVRINMRVTIINGANAIKNGGRAMAVTVDPTNSNNVWVASATGGLFHSTDAGAHWAHVDELGQFGMFDVQFAPSDPNTIIATCIEDTKASNGGGIWLSTDAGASWDQPPGSRIYKPRAGKKEPRVTKRYSAY